MRQDIQQLCVTTWGAVLEFRGWHYNGKTADKLKIFAHVACPHSIDSGQYIGTDEVTLIARKKQTK